MSTKQPSREDRARRLIAEAAAGKFESASKDFDDTLKAAMPPDKFAETWKQVEAGAGSYEAIESVAAHDETRDDRTFHVVVATTRFSKTRLVLRIAYGVDEKVVGFFVQPFHEPVAKWDPPAYANPSAFTERAVNVGTSPALPGTLTIPKGAGPFPAIVLVHGSGPNDQDETILGSRPFRDLAWGLASRGVAVLRYEKRSLASPSGIVTQKEEVLDAVHDALALLGSAAEIDAKRIYVLGHSQGGYLAPRLGENEHAKVRGLVILAGSTIPLEDSLVNQLAYFQTLAPDNEPLKKQLAAAQEFKHAVRAPSLKRDDDLTFPIGGSRAKGAYFLDVRGYDPVATASLLSCRILVLQGERDYQVTPHEFEAWKRGLAGKDAAFHLYPKLNHLFMSGEGAPSPAEYARPNQHVDEQVVSDIATWIRS